MVELKIIRTIVHPVRDLNESVAAWSKIMGKPVYKSDTFATFVGEDGIDIRLSSVMWSNQPITFWEVKDIETACTEMVASDATAMRESDDGPLVELPATDGPATGIINKPGRMLAVFKLADGNFIGLLQDL